MTVLQSRSPAILLVEDDAGHALLITKNLRRSGVASDIVVLDSGQKAVDYLLRKGNYSEADHLLPNLVLLDLNLPFLNGEQVLKIVKSHERTKQIPVAVLTTTDNPHEVEQCYALGCNMYIIKPVEYDQFSDAIQKLGKFVSILKTPDRRITP